MTPEQKIFFIKYIVEKRTQGYMNAGCESDWFYDNFKTHKNIITKNPKYIKISSLQNNLEYIRPAILISEKATELKYSVCGITTYICENQTLSSLYLWENGAKKKTFGKLYIKEISENEYIDWMYGIAKSYFENDIEPVLKEQENREILNNKKLTFSLEYFKLIKY